MEQHHDAGLGGDELSLEEKLRVLGNWSKVPLNKWLTRDSAAYGADKSLARYLKADQEWLNANWPHEDLSQVPWLKIAGELEGFGEAVWIARVRSEDMPKRSVAEQYPGLVARAELEARGEEEPEPSLERARAKVAARAAEAEASLQAAREASSQAALAPESIDFGLDLGSKRQLDLIAMTHEAPPPHGDTLVGDGGKRRKTAHGVRGRAAPPSERDYAARIETARSLVAQLGQLRLSPELLFSLLGSLFPLAQACKAVAQQVERESISFKDNVLVPWQREREANNKRKGLAAYAGPMGRLDFHSEEDYKHKMVTFAPACLGLLEAMSRGKHKDPTSVVVLAFDAMLRNKFHSGRSGNTTAFFEMTVRDSFIRRSNNLSMVGLDHDARRSLGLYPSSLRVLENAVSEARAKAPAGKGELGSWSEKGPVAMVSRLQSKLDKAAKTFEKKQQETTAHHPHHGPPQMVSAVQHHAPHHGHHQQPMHHPHSMQQHHGQHPQQQMHHPQQHHHSHHSRDYDMPPPPPSAGSNTHLQLLANSTMTAPQGHQHGQQEQDGEH